VGIVFNGLKDQQFTDPGVGTAENSTDARKLFPKAKENLSGAVEARR
jgi:hypothetical protein